MKKTAEQEVKLKLAIRNIIVRNPLISGHQLCRDLAAQNFVTALGNPLDWFYVAKLVRKLNRESALAADTQKIGQRLAITKERYRVIIEKLWKIIDWKEDYIKEGIFLPNSNDIIKAANTIIKLDLAILQAEMDAGIFERKLGALDMNLYRATQLPPEVAQKISSVFKAWGIDLALPDQRPKIKEPVSDATNGREGVSATS
jgi:hypothetical protein